MWHSLYIINSLMAHMMAEPDMPRSGLEARQVKGGTLQLTSRKIPGRHDVFFLVPLSKQFVHEYLADTDNLGNV